MYLYSERDSGIHQLVNLLYSEPIQIYKTSQDMTPSSVFRFLRLLYSYLVIVPKS